MAPPVRNRHGRPGRVKGHGAPSFIYVGPYGWDPWYGLPGTPTVTPGYEFATPQAPGPPETGSLRLEVQPSAVVQVYVDGFYVGMAEDLGGELTLEEGPHAIELRAPGYETVSLAVRILPGRTMVFRQALVSRNAGAVPDAAVRSQDEPVPSKPVYFIPGCYMGNVPPAEAGLPATCDQSRVRMLDLGARPR
jgi:hypothetical protein